MVRIYPAIKRIIDFSVALAGLIVLLPLFLLIAIAVKLDSKGPVIFRQERLTKGAKPFTIYKFRSMVQGARPRQLKGTSADEVTTKAGSFLRKTHLDEFPQLVNVLKGEMSLVGPRPLIAENEIRRLKEDIERVKRYKVKVGLAGLERIAGLAPARKKKILSTFPNSSSLLKGGSEIAFDYYYVENYSFKMDFILFFETFFMSIRKIFKHQG